MNCCPTKVDLQKIIQISKKKQQVSCDHDVDELEAKLVSLEQDLGRLQALEAKVKSQSGLIKQLGNNFRERDFSGDKGQKGTRGVLGHKGEGGAAGAHGSCSEVSDDPAKGPLGPPGHKGVKGEPGTQGHCKCRGDRGEKGLPGEDVKGHRGQQGYKGQKGERGVGSRSSFGLESEVEVRNSRSQKKTLAT